MIVGLELASDGLDEILQRDEPLDFTVFVDHKGHLHARRFEVLEQLHAG